MDNPFIVIQTRITTDLIINGVVATNFTISEDIDGNKIPAKIKICDILVHPQVSTIREIMLYSKASRLADNSANHSLIYQDTWSDFTETSDELTIDSTERGYNDRDAINQNEGSIYGTIRIKSGENNSAFAIDIFFCVA